MRRLVLRVVLGVVAIASAVLWIRQGWLLASAGLVFGAGIVWLGRCRHPRPLGLHPPLVDKYGTHHPAQWYCGQCGKVFPATFERGHAPVQRFAGHDESKATESAHRANVFYARRRQLAVQRAGMTKRPATAPRPDVATQPAPQVAARAAAAGPVPIHDHRRAG